MCFYMITKMGIEPTNYPCDAGCATLNIQSVYSVSNQTNCIPLHYLSMSASSLPYRNTLPRRYTAVSQAILLCLPIVHVMYFDMVGPPGLEPGTGGLKVRCDNHFTTIPYVVPRPGFEPGPCWLRVRCANHWRQRGLFVIFWFYVPTLDQYGI